jgi:hypothetical protein
MDETQTIKRTDPQIRNLKIEEHGNLFRGMMKPKIRLMGHWLNKAGFNPGGRVEVVCVAPGLIELRKVQ